MKERLTGIKEWSTGFWRERSKKQRWFMIAGLVIILIAIIVGSMLANREKFVPLYSNLSAQEAGQIKTELDAKGVSSELSNGGTTISVPKENVDSLKVELASQGIPKSGSIDYSFFSESSGFGMTDNEFSVLKVDAMQTELANLIKGIDGVQDANVMISLPKDSVWVSDKGEEAQASIVLTTKPGYQFDDQQIQSLYHLVSKSVPNLPTDNIAIMNQYFEYYDLANNDGKNPEGGVASIQSQYAMKKQVERDIQREVQKMLGAMIGQDKVVVSVSTDIDFTQETREENLVEPVDKENMEGIAVSAERLTETYTGENAAQGGTAGTGDGEVPNYESSEENGDGDYERKEEKINNEVNRIRRQIVESPYKVKDLGIQVMVEPPKKNDPNSLPAGSVDDIQQILGTIVKTTIQQDDDEQALTDEQIEDKIAVSVQPFNGKTAVAQEVSSSIPLWMYIIGGVLLLAVIILAFLLIRRRKEPEWEEEDWEEAYALGEEEEEEEEQPLTEEQQRRQRLEDLAQGKPDEFVKLLRSWLTED
ncbi:flagellar M-ring protein FliF [Bacillus endophyticus]|uniref:flagellar basal-body MS-ring/collar protein FliF n=1 Tax=Priestia endophytica TaxID=135735 RepID=UPI0018CF2C7B|nr:flagellar basal-body MS-ring/collar protein FliF [Priestia endophytica]MBG9814714.1 flagellar M-ring protein FliF [Priestia endophytica]